MNTCGSCGFENDPTRVFCQNCGAKLEAAPQAPSRQSPQPYRYTDRSTAPVRRQGSLALLGGALIREILLIGVLAALAAALLLTVMSPDGIPESTVGRASVASVLAADIQAARENVYPRSMEITQADANNFLVSRVTSAGEGGGVLSARFERAFVVFGNATLTLGVQQNVRQLPVFLQLEFRPVSKPPGTTLQLTGGSIGRLRVPGIVLPFFAKTFVPVTDALTAPLEWFGAANEVVLAPGVATARWPGKTETP